MAHLNLSYEDLASVICIAACIAGVDGSADDSEVAAIIKSLTDQYNFEGQADLLRSYLADGSHMDPNDAVRRIAAFGPVEKQWASNFFAKTIVADNVLDEREKALYWKVMDICGLPDNNL